MNTKTLVGLSVCIYSACGEEITGGGGGSYCTMCPSKTIHFHHLCQFIILSQSLGNGTPEKDRNLKIFKIFPVTFSVLIFQQNV